jgi:hypothetical protein
LLQHSSSNHCIQLKKASEYVPSFIIVRLIAIILKTGKIPCSQYSTRLCTKQSVSYADFYNMAQEGSQWNPARNFHQYR